MANEWVIKENARPSDRESGLVCSPGSRRGSLGKPGYHVSSPPPPSMRTTPGPGPLPTAWPRRRIAGPIPTSPRREAHVLCTQAGRVRRSGLVRPPPRFPERWTVTATALSPVTVTGAGAAAARFGLGCFGGVGGKRYKILHINDPERVFTGCVVATCSLPRGGKKKPCASVVFPARPRIQHS